jgi:hypothetical protein
MQLNQVAFHHHEVFHAFHSIKAVPNFVVVLDWGSSYYK